MVRELKPRRILEIGSGHTSALILDTNERYFGGGIDCTFFGTLSRTSDLALTP